MVWGGLGGGPKWGFWGGVLGGGEGVPPNPPYPPNSLSYLLVTVTPQLKLHEAGRGGVLRLNARKAVFRPRVPRGGGGVFSRGGGGLLDSTTRFWGSRGGSGGGPGGYFRLLGDLGHWGRYTAGRWRVTDEFWRSEFQLMWAIRSGRRKLSSLCSSLLSLVDV